jgi:hypothetical protein
MAGARRKRRPNGDLIEAAESVLPDILRFYRRFRDNRPVMLLDLPGGRIYGYPYEQFKADLSGRSQATLAASYEQALAGNKVVVFVRDNETRRLVSILFNEE